ncbi:MAG: hypothetical protein WC966_04235 [Bradymonadales bacterium]|jgi:hypothetical protein
MTNQELSPQYFDEIDAVIATALQIENDSGYDEAAKFLGTKRRAIFSQISEDASDESSDQIHLSALGRIVEAQCRCFIKMGAHPLCIGAAEWYIHLLHAHGGKKAALWQASREQISLLFFHYAQALFSEARIEEGRVAMRTALDSTRQLNAAILKAMLIITKLCKIQPKLEELEPKQWMSMRMAEFLAQLDFAGQNQSAFRKTLDTLLQYLQNPQNVSIQETLAKLETQAKAESELLLKIVLQS